MAWRVLLKALERLEGVEGVAHIIDPKAISKDHLYGTLDPNTREWTDGLFTHVLRKYVYCGGCSDSGLWDPSAAVTVFIIFFTKSTQGTVRWGRESV